MLRVLLLLLISGTIFAQNSNDTLRQAIGLELEAISRIAHQEVLHFENVLLSEGDSHDWIMDMAKSDNQEYRAIRETANLRITQLSAGLSLAWAKIYLQRLRNRLYAIHPSMEELRDAGIKRRSAGLLDTGMNAIASATNLAVKCSAIITAYNTLSGFTSTPKPSSCH